MAITFILDVIIIAKVIFSCRLIIIFFFFFFKKYPDISNHIILNYSFIFFFSSFFFFCFKKCLYVSNNCILIYSVIMLLFYSKNVLISLTILSFNLSLIILSFFPITFLSINRSNHFLIIGLIFLISCSSNLSISSLDTIIGLWNSSSISLLIFSFLSFSSLPFNPIKYFSNSKRPFFYL